MKTTNACLRIAVIVLLCGVMPAYSLDQEMMLMGEDIPEEKSSAQLQFQHVPESDGSPAITYGQLRGQYVVSENPTRTWTLQQRAAQFRVGAPLTIPDNGLVIPRTLELVDTGVAYNRRLQGDRNLGLRLQAGSASDRIFDSFHELVIEVTAVYRKPAARPRRVWLFILNYSNNRNFLNNIPFPTFAYFMESASHRWRTIIGFPFFSTQYKPAPAVDFRLGLFGPRRFGAQAGYTFKESRRLYGGFEWSSLEWMRADREDKDDRLFYVRKRLVAGFQMPVIRDLRLDLSGGREFDRRFFENHDATYHDVPSLGLRPAWLISLKVSYLRV